jgi:hypothetical protein
MRSIKPFGVAEYLDLLRAQKSGVLLNLPDMPGPRELHAAFRGLLERDDLDRIYLWFQFRKYTGGPNSKLTDVGEAVDRESRVRSFAHGDPAKGKCNCLAPTRSRASAA